MSNKKLIRSQFRKDVFNRDKYCCRVCGRQGKDRQGGEEHLKYHKNPVVDLDSHHIINRILIANQGYVKENGISLCDDCHLKAEVYWNTGLAEEDFSPDDLFKLIGSSLEQAEAAALIG